MADTPDTNENRGLILAIPDLKTPGTDWPSGLFEEVNMWARVRAGVFLHNSETLAISVAARSDKESSQFFEESIWLAGAVADSMGQAMAATAEARYRVGVPEFRSADVHYHLLHGADALLASLHAAGNFLIRSCSALQDPLAQMRTIERFRGGPKAQPLHPYSDIDLHWPAYRAVPAILTTASPRGLRPRLDDAIDAIEEFTRLPSTAAVHRYRDLAFHRHRTNPAFAYGTPVWRLSPDGAVSSFSPGPTPRDEQLEKTMDISLKQIEDFRDAVSDALPVLRIAGDRLREEFVNTHVPLGTVVNISLARHP